MRKLFILTLILFIFPGEILSEPQGGILRSGIVIQKWTVEDLTDPISEGTFPIEFIYPIRDNLNIQINHSPALSRFGDYDLSGLSDTWIRSTFKLADNRTLFSAGIGLPTGKTKLDDSEMMMTGLLSQNALKFQLPVFGQGLTLSGGVMYAYPVNNQLTVGLGLNYVYRGSYKFSKLQSLEFNPGDQLGVNAGFDYIMSSRLRSNVDIVFNYYTADKVEKTELFSSGPKLTLKAGFQYQVTFGSLWMRLHYRYRAKNETWDGQALVPESKNSNVTQREVELGSKINLTEIIFLNVNGEIRSYVENESGSGWIDLFGAGLGYEVLFSPNFSLSMAFKLFFGDGDFATQNRYFSGTEFQINTQWKFNN
jgi:hypothetical protein